MGLTFTDEENLLIDNCYTLILNLAKEAGKIVIAGFAELNKHVDTKTGTWDLVTEYDRNVENLLVNGILASYPEHKYNCYYYYVFFNLI